MARARFQKGDNLGAALGRRDHEHILGIAQDGIREEDEEEHQAERQHLLELLRRPASGPEALRCRRHTG